MLDKKNSDLMVVQSNKLVEAHYKQEYSVQEQRTVLWLIGRVHREDYIYHQNNELKEIQISASDYAKLMDIPVSHVYRDAKQIGESLMEKVLSIKEPNGWLLVHWVSSMRYDNGVITVKIHPDLIPYLIDLQEKFTKFRLENILYLNSTYAIKIYQLLAQYATIGKKKISVDDLRSTLGITEIKTYKLYGDVKRKILEISKREINAKTDLTMDYEEKKVGRRVTEISFKITKKQTQEEQAKEMFKACVRQDKDEALNYLLKTCVSDEDFFRQNLVAPAFENFLQEKISNYEPKSSKPLQTTESTT